MDEGIQLNTEFIEYAYLVIGTLPPSKVDQLCSPEGEIKLSEEKI